MPLWHTCKVKAVRIVEFMSAWLTSGTFNMHACVESPASILSEQWTCADEMHNVINKTYFRFGTTFFLRFSILYYSSALLCILLITLCISPAHVHCSLSIEAGDSTHACILNVPDVSHADMNSTILTALTLQVCHRGTRQRIFIK